ncbi:DnrO protein [Cognatilysobacter tabacisoli]|uniref:DnrO protein n=1 Tax=Cognatilysobacter tabacisoli TaxID=2315424 RepID=UPI000E6B4861|nr:DnrO protein [Lysobacter tabacisoli]
MRPSLTAFSVVLAMALAGAPGHAQDHADHHPASPATTDAAPAQRWVADATLAENMRGIRVAVDALDHYRHGHIGPEQAAILAAKIRGHANEIVAKCTLPADADAALHAILVPLMSGAAALQRDPTQTAAIAPMQDALRDYERQFAQGPATNGASKPD